MWGCGQDVATDVEDHVGLSLRRALNVGELLAAELEPAEEPGVLRHEAEELAARLRARRFVGQALAEGEHLARVHPLRAELDRETAAGTGLSPRDGFGRGWPAAEDVQHARHHRLRRCALEGR